MSLSTFLLPKTAEKGKSTAIDEGLDVLFRTHAPSSQPPAAKSSSQTTAVLTSSARKRKGTEERPNKDSKRSKSGAEGKLLKHGSKSAHPANISETDDSEDGDDANVHSEGSSPRGNLPERNLEEGSSDDDNGDSSRLVHEFLLKSDKDNGQSRHGKSKYVPQGETGAQRDARTVFVGNVAVEVTKSRPAQKQLKRHILSFVHSAKIESIRFRSIAFKRPTSELPSLDEGNSELRTRDHDRERAAAWRSEDKDESSAAPAKRFLTLKEKKRVAFIKHEIHDQVASVNAYVVFAHPPPLESNVARSANPAPPTSTMDPYEAARQCAEKCDGSTFLERTLRVDVVKKGARPGAEGEGGAIAGDPKATIFVGNLDFASKEEDLRAFFESLVCGERGQPRERVDESEEESEDDDEAQREGGTKPPRWVKHVRIIRDRDTQLGKGFAYIHFIDRECADEVLALEETKLKFAKRKLRVQRCKTLPGGPKLRAVKHLSSARPDRDMSNPKSAPGRPHSAPRLAPVSKEMHKGNPELGVKLAHLPKEERKKVKAMDPDRLARRLAKKRAKAFADKGVESRVDKVRVRERTNERHGKGGAHHKEGAKAKKRVRSGKALAKMNTKK